MTQSAALGNSTSIASPFLPSSREEKTVSNLVIRFYLQSLAVELLPGERVRGCLRFMLPKITSVRVLKSPHKKRAHYSGLMVCGSVWSCPVCAAKITEHRRQELTAALALSDSFAMLATYTLRHNQKDKLTDMVDNILESFRFMKSGKAWQGIKSDYRWIGSVRSIEITHGANGWHPHIHELILVSKKLSRAQVDSLLKELKTRWINALQKHGKDASWSHGVDLRTADNDVRDYIAKFGHEPVTLSWGIEHELTKAPTKKAHKDGRTPMQLLADYGNADMLAGRLWVEYATTFKGRNQLVWSKGLRELLGLGIEQPDGEIAEQIPSDAVQLALLSKAEWKFILSKDKRGELLHMATTLDYDDFQDWLNDTLGENLRL